METANIPSSFASKNGLVCVRLDSMKLTPTNSSVLQFFQSATPLNAVTAPSGPERFAPPYIAARPLA